MKKNFLIALILLVAFTSCKKEDESYFVKFTVDGVNKTYTQHVLAHFDTVGGNTALTILGAGSSAAFDNYLGIYLDNYPGNAAITTGQYLDDASSYTLLSTYANNSFEYEAGQTVALDAVAHGVTITNHFKLNITSLTSNSVRGTFSGDYYQDGNATSPTKLNITNGEFYVRIE